MGRQLASKTTRKLPSRVRSRSGAKTSAAAEAPAFQTDQKPRSLAWAQHFLPHFFSEEPCAFHRELLADLEAAERRLIARVAPRGHAKSTCAALAYPLFCICERLRRNIVIISHEAGLATQFVSDIRHELESNERLIEAYGDLCRAPRVAAKSVKSKSARLKWSAAHFRTASGISVQARGAGSTFRGTRVGPHRPDLIICDDIEHDRQVATPAGRQKLERWLRRVVMPALAPGGQLVVVGSLLHHDSLLANLSNPQRFPRWDYRIYRALEGRPLPEGGFAIEPLWPARWPRTALDEERQRIGSLAFEQEYMANPVDEVRRVFPPERLKRYEESELAGRDLTTVMAVDPATGAAHGDFFALWVGSVADDGTIYTRELTLERCGVVQQVERIFAAFGRWQPVKIGIETNGYQVALRDILLEVGRARQIYPPVAELKSTGSKAARIEGAAVLFESGAIRFPKTLDPEVENQFLQFPSGAHDDAPDVCVMGIEVARSFRERSSGDFLVGQRKPFARRGAW